MRLYHPLFAALLVIAAACAPTRQAPADATASPSASPSATAASTAPPSAAPSHAAASAAPAVASAAPPVATPTPTLAPTPAVRPSAAPQRNEIPVPTATPTLQPTVAPSAPVATATPVGVPERAPNAPPEIVRLHIDKTQLRGGDTVSGEVVTSSNVASVEARIANFSVPVPRVAVGRFALAYTVPNLPFFLRGHAYALEVIARNSAGAAVSRSVPIMIR